MKDLNNPYKQRGLVIWKHTEYDLLDIVNVNPVSNPKEMRHRHTKRWGRGGRSRDCSLREIFLHNCKYVHPVQNPNNRWEKRRSLWFADSQPMRENAALREEREQQQQQLQWNSNIQTEVQVVLLPMIQRQRETEWDIQVKAKRVRPTTTAIKSKHPNRSSGRHFATIQRERDVLV